MNLPDTRIVGFRDRRWARRREYQNFLGEYVKHGDLWFESRTSAQDVEEILAAFRELPEALRRLAGRYELTVSCTTGRAAVGSISSSANGAISAIYGDWEAVTPTSISPHLQIGSESRTSEALLRGHIAHELAHLLFADMVASAREKFVLALRESMECELFDVTLYVDSCRQKHCDGACCKLATDVTKGRCLWAREAFAETVACWCVPEYPERNEQSTVDLAERIRLIEDLSGINLSA